MNYKLGSHWLLAALAALAMVVAACGSTNTPATSKGTITIAGFNFPESSILAEVYGQALAHDGYTINYKLNLGNREVVSGAIKTGQVDLYPGYAATDLEFYNKGAGEASGDAVATTAKLNTHLSSLSLVALTPSAAVDQNAFAVTQDTATKFNLTKLSDLAAIGNQLVLGGPPECHTRPFCQPGLQSTYGITFKDFKALDADGPLTRAALKNGSIQVGLVFSSDADLNSLGPGRQAPRECRQRGPDPAHRGGHG
jgi:osmoprotectant transport system substrate-binding protein